ncbi:hypothetical protein [Spirillospora sp. CA-294931]|uniref:hypothetical protein n=1 Tax=Spirillospora sp. CA-294931 TaxID=3240042 RepID=UPI003D8A61DF
MIVPDAILEIAAKADPDALEDQARELQSSGGSIRSAGVQIDRTWQGLSTVYRAPEATDLLAATAPIKTAAQTAETELNRAAIALVHYAQEVRAIKARLKTLHTEARTVVAKADAMGPEKFEEDDDLQQQNDSLINQVNALAMAFQAAQEKCARAIYAAYGGKMPSAQKPTGKPQPLPWGTTENPDLPWYKDAWNGGKSLLTGFFKDGLFGDVQGIWNLATSPSKWWGTYKTIMALGAPIFFTPVMIVPSVRRKSFESWRKFGKSFVAWNRWKDDPARAAGQTLYNIITTVVPVGRAATPATLAADAGKTARTLHTINRATRYIDPIGEGTRLAGKGPKVGDLLKHLNLKSPSTPNPEVRFPDPQRTPGPEPSDPARSPETDRGPSNEPQGEKDTEKGATDDGGARSGNEHTGEGKGEGDGSESSGSKDDREGGRHRTDDPSRIYRDEHGRLTNGTYTVDRAKQNRHAYGHAPTEKSEFLPHVDADKATLDAASYADKHDLWTRARDGAKAKVYVVNGPVGVHKRTGELTSWLNVYKDSHGKIHASPGSPA